MTPATSDRAAALVDALSRVLALPIDPAQDPAHREGVIEHVVRILTMAALLTEFSPCRRRSR